MHGYVIASRSPPGRVARSVRLAEYDAKGFVAYLFDWTARSVYLIVFSFGGGGVVVVGQYLLIGAISFASRFYHTLNLLVKICISPFTHIGFVCVLYVGVCNDGV